MTPRDEAGTRPAERTAERTADRAVASVRDAAGHVAIGDYGVIGNGRSVALVAPDGGVDWWAAPRLDSKPLVGALLDPTRGGVVRLAPTDPAARTSVRYLPDTNVVETTFRTDAGEVRVTDALNSGNAGALPWSELARRVDGVRGSVEMRFVARPGTGLRTWEPWGEEVADAVVLHAGDSTLGIRCSDGVSVRQDGAAATATFTVAAGERTVVAVVASQGEPLFLADVGSVDGRVDLTVDNWRDWCTQVRWDGAHRDAVVRSALALKLLVMAETGAIAAAATTSLPERVGGRKNWDYRYCWVRDAAFTIDAMTTCGLEEETHAAVAWLLRTIRDNGPGPHVMYTLDGGLLDATREPDVPGWRGSRPVRVGNDAAGQRQLGVYGDLFGTVAAWVAAGHVLDTRTARELADLADDCADSWRHDDAGIWELGENRPYTSSKMNAWLALDRAATMAQEGTIPGPARRWRAEADRVRAWVHEHCWSQALQAWAFYAGCDELDASVLLGARSGFDRGPRMSATLDAVARQLGAGRHGHLTYRYSGVEAEEETFLACSFWRVQALASVGRCEEARRLLGRLDEVASPLGLMSEMVVAGTGELVGNLPQALSHLAHIGAVAAAHGPDAAGGARGSRSGPS